jgi:hypothetical protein
MKIESYDGVSFEFTADQYITNDINGIMSSIFLENLLAFIEGKKVSSDMIFKIFRTAIIYKWDKLIKLREDVFLSEAKLIE